MRNPPAQKGIHALFTPRKSRSKRKEVIGILIASTGALVWAWAILAFTGLAQTIIVEDRTSFSIILLSIALPMIASGSTVFAYSRGSNRGEEEFDEFDETGSLAKEVEPLTKKENNLPPDLQSSLEMRKGMSRLSTLALLEGVVIIALYIGLVREYDSSLYMRVWLQANLPVATIFLNDNVLFLMAGIIISAAMFRLGARKRRS
jgi:hypothetical protein